MPNKKDGKTFDDNNFIEDLKKKLTKNPTSILWGILLAWNILGIFDLFGAMVLTFIVPYQPLPEIGLNEIGVRTVLSINSLIQISAIIILFNRTTLNYFKVN